MIRARLDPLTAGDPTYYLGLTAENVARLVDGKPIKVSLAELGGAGTVVIGYGVTHQAIASHQQVGRMGDLGTRTGRAIHGMLTRPRPGGLGTTGHPMHDPCVIAFLLWPELFSGRDCFVEVETGAGPLRGRTTIDWNGRLKRAPNALVIDRVEAYELFERMVAALSKLP